MSSLALVDAAIWLGGYDWSTQSNYLTVDAEAQEEDATTFQSGGYRARAGTLKTAKGELRGLWQSATQQAPDPEAFSSLGVVDRVFTASPAGVEAQPAYLYKAMGGKYQQFDEIGKLAPFTLALAGNSGPEGLVRGQIAKARGNVSATGPLGSALNLGAPLSTQFVYATFHVFTAGTTITVLVESDTAVGFPSPTTRATIGPLTVIGGTWLVRVPGPFAGETHWRLNVSAITGTFNVGGSIAVQ